MQDYILMVEDDNEINHMLKELLQGRGYGVKSAYSGTEELLARLEAALRRCANGGRQEGRNKVLAFKDIVMDTDQHRVTVSGQEISLTKREYLILELLISNPNKVFTKNNIYESVWNEEFVGEDNAVNVHISNIRQKLAKVNDRQTYIQTVWGIGFKMKTL